jgi:glutathione peroxidase
MAEKLYAFSPLNAQGEPHALDAFRGKVLLIVNTASKCGFTPQFEGLEALHQQYAERGLAVLGFPCNQFGKQDPGSNEEIQSFCQLNYGVSFPMFGKLEVNGGNAAPLFKHLKSEAPGALGTEAIKWNFTKFLVDREGNVVKRFASATKPEQLASAIEALL